MKLIILKNNLKEGLSAVERATTDSSNLPILKNILCKTDAKTIRLSATNLEIGVHKFVSGKVIEEGEITIPFAPFYNIISNTDSERVSLETEDNNLYIKTDNYQAKIQGMNSEEFPIIPSITNQDSFIEINSSVLKESLESTVYAAHISEIRPEISGVLFDFQTTILKFVATDSFRLAEKILNNRQFKTTYEKGFQAIIPLKTIQEIIRTFSNDVLLKIIIDQNQILIKTEGQELISRLISGQYPDYEQIIPKETETEILLERDKLLNAIRLVSSFSGRVNDVKMKAEEGGKTLEVYSASQGLGENNYLIPVKITGPEINEISFNWRYILDGIKAIKSKDLLLGINSENKPALMRAPDEMTYRYIVMPIKAT